jgi:hypothetical protein
MLFITVIYMCSTNYSFNSYNGIIIFCTSLHLLWYHFISRWFNFRVFRPKISARDLSPAKLKNLMVCLNGIKQLREFIPPLIIYLRFLRENSSPRN